MRSFAIIKTSRNDKLTLSFTDIGKTCLSHEFLMSQLCLLPLYAKNKIIAKSSEFTVYKPVYEILVLIGA